MQGRRFRNLRQAIQRSRNAGVTVELHREGDLGRPSDLECARLMARSRRDEPRGFSMILGGLFDRPRAGCRRRRSPATGDGGIVGAHRYLWAGKQDLSLDFPLALARRPTAWTSG